MNIDKVERVGDMYIKKDTLSTRINLHEKYSINKYGWHNWVFDQYKLIEKMNILEFGCGTGNTWIGKEKNIHKNIKLILTDISPLMIEKINEKLDKNLSFKTQVVDIQNTPFKDNEFDVVIANHMLYHVPDIAKALSEVKRILKNDGYFYTTTFGENSLKELQDIYRIYKNEVKFQFSNECSFTLENGNDILGKYFKKIEKELYIDSLEVTDANDLMDYITSYNNIPNNIYEEIYRIVKDQISKEGVFRIRKDQGMFVCRK